MKYCRDCKLLRWRVLDRRMYYCDVDKIPTQPQCDCINPKKFKHKIPP